MTRLENLENDIRKLGSEELAALRDWLLGYDADLWDRQIEEDERSGKLDRLAEEAVTAHNAGRTKPL